MSMIIIYLFLTWRLLDFTIAYLIPNIISYLGFFPYKDLLNSYRLPEFLTAFANFDGAHYISIAGSGYHQFEQAFFPLYPLLMNIIAPVFKGNYLLAGLIISNAAFLIGLIFFKKYLDVVYCHAELGSASVSNKILKPSLTRRNEFGMTNWPILFLLFFPTSFFFGAVYTEGLFFLLVILALYFLQKEKYFAVAAFACLASLTRLIGVFLIIPIAIKLFEHTFLIHDSSFWGGVKRRLQNLILIKPDSGRASPGIELYLASLARVTLLFSPLLGLALYSLYLWQTTGDPFLFFNAQGSFNLNRSTHLILLPQVFYRYLKIFLTASHNFQYYISLLEFITFNFVLIFLTLDLLRIIKNFKLQTSYTRLGLNLFSFSNLLLPTLTGTLLSIPRFSLLSLSLFIYLAEIKNTPVKTIIAVIFLILHAVILGFFVQGYFIS